MYCTTISRYPKSRLVYGTGRYPVSGINPHAQKSSMLLQLTLASWRAWDPLPFCKYRVLGSCLSLEVLLIRSRRSPSGVYRVGETYKGTVCCRSYSYKDIVIADPAGMTRVLDELGSTTHLNYLYQPWEWTTRRRLLHLSLSHDAIRRQELHLRNALRFPDKVRRDTREFLRPPRSVSALDHLFMPPSCLTRRKIL